MGVVQLANNRPDTIRAVAKNRDGSTTLICVVLLRVALLRTLFASNACTNTGYLAWPEFSRSP